MANKAKTTKQSNEQSSVETVIQTQGETTMQANEQTQKQLSAFELLRQAQIEFEQKKTEAIRQVRELCENWCIDLKKDVFPEQVKPRKPYTKRIKVEAAPASPLQASQGSQMQAGEATHQASESKALEPAHI